MPKPQNEGIPYITTSNFVGDNSVDFKNAKKISLDEYQELAKKIRPRVDDVIMARYASIGAARYVDKTFPTKFLPSYACTIIRRKLEQIEGSFLYFDLQSPNVKKEIKINTKTGSQANIGIKDLGENIDIKFPIKLEQNKIIHIFKEINKIIFIQQKELDSFEKIKKSLLQKMFADRKNSIPKLRFKNFTGNWERNQLGNVSIRYDNLRVPITSQNRIKGATPYYGANGIQDYVKGHTHNGEFVLVAEDGAQTTNPYPVRYVSGKFWANNHVHVIQSNIKATNLFLTYILKSTNFKTYLVGGSRSKLNAEVLMKMRIYLPSKHEQEKVGKLLQTTDKLIDLQKHKIDSIQQIKKWLLQNMFI